MKLLLIDDDGVTLLDEIKFSRAEFEDAQRRPIQAHSLIGSLLPGDPPDEPLPAWAEAGSEAHRAAQARQLPYEVVERLQALGIWEEVERLRELGLDPKDIPGFPGFK